LQQAPPPFDVDAVITWVNGDDPAHRRKLQAFLQDNDSGRMAAADPTRFGDCGEIEYCVASLLRFAPWLRTIHIVSDEQTPALSDQLKGSAFENRVRVVDHREFFVGYEQFLPTFSNRSIECLLWRIPDLAERFIYFNDDYQLIRPVAIEDFFGDEGVVLRGQWRPGSERRWGQRLKSLFARLLPGRAKSATTARPGNNFAQELSARMAGFTDKYLQVPHVPHPMRKSTLSRYFAGQPELLPNNLRHRLRSTEQFLSTSLSAHLELAAGSARIDNRLRTLRLKADTQSARRLQAQIVRADASEQTAFACVQSLDLAGAPARAVVFDWLDRRVGRLADLLGAHERV
jgi:hypothetical protein